MTNPQELQAAVNQLANLFPGIDRDTMKEAVAFVIDYVDGETTKGAAISAELIELGFYRWFAFGQELYKRYKNNPDFRANIQKKIATDLCNS